MHQQVLGALFAVVTCATVGFRQRYPATAGMTAQGLMALDFLTWHNLAAGAWTIAWFCSLYGLAVWSSRWHFVAGATFVGLTDLSPVGRDADPANWSSTAIGFALGTVVVMVVIRRIVGDRDSRARLAERERDVTAREAVVEERARIARELHDAVAHSVSMMVIQAGAERRVVDDGSTREVLQTIEQIGRTALTEMRRLVGMLRTDSSDRLAPQPTLADLPMLMTQTTVTGEAGDGQDAVAAARRLRPDVVLMDIRMPVLDGIEATRRIVRAQPATRVLILTTFGLDDYVYDALRAGASGFMLKDAPPEEIAAAVRIVASGDALLAPAVTRAVIEEFSHVPARVQPAIPRAVGELTPREREVLDLLIRGLSNPEICRELVISEATAKTHVAKILQKLGLRDRVQAVIYAYESGLVSPGPTS